MEQNALTLLSPKNRIDSHNSPNLMSFLCIDCRRLDYDAIPDHTYNFTVTATDNGSPLLKGSASVRVSVTNVNDENPVFMQSVEYVQVSEDAPIATVIHVVQAYDPDGDDVTYSFSGANSYVQCSH